MKVQVIFASGDIGQVHQQTLDHFIKTDDVVAFRRSTGWTQIDRHRVRETQEPFTGPRKRWND